jgi:hypothetical protein
MPFSGQQFDPETLDFLTEVFEQTWTEAQRSVPMPDDASHMRERLASHIMDVASEGVRDPLLLKFAALRALFGRG